MPIITITRGSLRATDKLVERLAGELHCRPISREDVIEHGHKFGIEEFMHSARRIMETKPPHSWDPHAAQIHHYLTIFKASMMDFIVMGDMIYHGLQTHFILGDIPRVLRLKVIAPFDYRVKMVMEESESTREVARDHIKFVDEMRRSWVKFCFGENFDDPTNYDMILNMSVLNLDSMAGVVQSVVQRPEFRTDIGTVKAIRDAHFKANVNALLVKSPQTRDMELSIDMNAGIGHVRIKRKAPTASSSWEQEINDALSDSELIKSIEIEEEI